MVFFLFAVKRKWFCCGWKGNRRRLSVRKDKENRKKQKRSERRLTSAEQNRNPALEAKRHKRKQRTYAGGTDASCMVWQCHGFAVDCADCCTFRHLLCVAQSCGRKHRGIWKYIGVIGTAFWLDCRTWGNSWIILEFLCTKWLAGYFLWNDLMLDCICRRNWKSGSACSVR